MKAKNPPKPNGKTLEPATFKLPVGLLKAFRTHARRLKVPADHLAGDLLARAAESPTHTVELTVDLPTWDKIVAVADHRGLSTERACRCILADGLHARGY